MSEQLPASSRLSFVPIVMTVLTACGDPGRPAAPTTPRVDTGTSSSAVGATVGARSAPGTPLSWDAGGFVAPARNPFAIQGPFYFYSDCDPPSGLPCTAPDATLSGADGKPGWSVSPAGVCAKGTAVKVENGKFSEQWGAGLALDLNSKGGAVGTPAVKGAFDLARAGIRGFSVDLTGTAPAEVRINLSMPGLPDASFVTAKVPGTTTFDLTDAKQGSWVTSKTPLDPTRVEALQFQVYTTASAATPYDFCVNAIRVIANDTPAASGGSSG